MMCVKMEGLVMGLEKYYKVTIRRLELQIVDLTTRLGYAKMIILLESLALITAILFVLVKV
jgi:hypothetical protein